MVWRPPSSNGPASAVSGRRAVPGLLGVALSVGLAVTARGIHGVVALGAEVVGVVGVVVLAQRRIGGFTGDVLGAAGVVGETLGLLALAAKW